MIRPHDIRPGMRIVLPGGVRTAESHPMPVTGHRCEHRICVLTDAGPVTWSLETARYDCVQVEP